MKCSAVTLEQSRYTELSSILQQSFCDQVRNVFYGDCDPENKKQCSLRENSDSTLNKRFLPFTKLIIIKNTTKDFLQFQISIVKPYTSVLPSHIVSVLHINYIHRTSQHML